MMSSSGQYIKLPALEQVIDRSPLVVSSETPLTDAISLMGQAPARHPDLAHAARSSHEILQSPTCSSAVLVMNGSQLAGIFTEWDVVKLAASGLDLSRLRLAEVMTQPVITLSLSDSVSTLDVLELFRQYPIHHLPVLDVQGQLVGLIASHVLSIQNLWQNQAEQRIDEFALKDEVGHFLTSHPIVVDMSDQVGLESERQRTALDLQHSEARYRLLFENNPTPMWMFDPETLAFLEVNQAVIAHYGYSQSEFLQMTIAEIRPPTDVAALLQTNLNLLPGHPHIGIWQHRKKDGSLIDVEVMAYAFAVEGKQVNLALMKDITAIKQAEAERQQAETALQDAQESLTIAIEAAQMGTWYLDLTRDVTPKRSLRHDQLFGYETLQPEWGQAIARRHIVESDREIFDAAFVRAAETGNLDCEFRVQWPDGSIHWMAARGRFYFDENGNPVTGGGINFDISDRKQAEEKIREQAALLDIATEAIYVRDLEHRILYWNQGAERLYGWRAAEAIGQKANELLQDDVSHLAKIMQTVLERGEWQGELRKVAKTGQEVIIESRWTLVRDEGGQPKSILSVNTNITERKQLEAQFLRAQRLESLGTLASGIAHDLNNILTPILAIAPLLPLSLPPLSTQSQKLLNMLDENAKRGADLVKQILIFARGLEGERTPVQLKHLLQELAQIINSTFPKSITLDRHIANRDLWLVSANATHLHQVFMNFCVNARDAMPQGGTLRIALENKTIDETDAQMNLEAKAGFYVVITFADTGTGISPEHIDRIFDPFFTTKPMGEGTGLGLATVVGIIKNHGGFVTVSSEVGQGTQFQVFLPALDGTEPPVESIPELPMGQGEWILLVDDEANIRETLNITLKNQNYRVLTAKDGNEAVAIYAKHREEIKVVLMDMMMPSMDGSTAIESIQNVNPQIKIIACSGLVPSESALEVAGVKAFLAKPFTTDALLNTLHRVLQEK